MRTVAIVQARMGSTRLPGKILADIGGMSMLARVVTRLRAATRLDDVVIATTTAAADEAVVREARGLEVGWHRGSEDDVLDRYCSASRAFSADTIVRITSDCPLIDGSIVDQVVERYSQEPCDIASTTVVRTYPRGLDTEVVDVKALERACREATAPYQRSHVTPYIYEHPKFFRLVSVCGDDDFSSLRWTVDTEADLDLVRRLYAGTDWQPLVEWREVLALIERQPELAALNSSVRQKPIQEG